MNPDAAADAELDAHVAEMLNRDVEKRRRRAWLRKVGVVSRIVVYACLLGALFFFKPEGVSNIGTKPLAQLALGDIVAALFWIIIGLFLLRALFKPNPRPDLQEAWGMFGLVAGGVLFLGGLFLYVRA